MYSGGLPGVFLNTITSTSVTVRGHLTGRGLPTIFTRIQNRGWNSFLTTELSSLCSHATPLRARHCERYSRATKKKGVPKKSSEFLFRSRKPPPHARAQNA